VLNRAALLLPNSAMEYEQLAKLGSTLPPHRVIPNGIDPALFAYNSNILKDPDLVLCVARIEGIKNQLQLIKALNNTSYRLVIIGAPAPNQPSYYAACRKMAASNISFLDPLSQADLVPWYQKAGVYILPSWFETCGFSTLEATASIQQAIDKAAHQNNNGRLRQKILNEYTWQQAAFQTAAAYKQVLSMQ
jgi:glycosyltransferase involved in cell wall biosynthesis